MSVSPDNEFNARKVTSVTLSAQMKHDIERLARAAYGPRGMARWLEEHLAAFLEDRSFISRIGASEAVTSMDIRKSLRLTPRAEGLLTEGVRRVRKIDPLSENPRSKILRAVFDYAIDQAQEEPAAGATSPGIDITKAAPRLVRKQARHAG